MKEAKAASLLFFPVFALNGLARAVDRREPENFNVSVKNKIGSVKGKFEINLDEAFVFHGKHFNREICIENVVNTYRQGKRVKVDLELKPPIQGISKKLLDARAGYTILGTIGKHEIESIPLLIPKNELPIFLDPNMDLDTIKKLVQEEWNMERDEIKKDVEENEALRQAVQDKIGESLGIDLLPEDSRVERLLQSLFGGPKDPVICRAGTLDGILYKMTVALLTQPELKGIFGNIPIEGKVKVKPDPRDPEHLRILKLNATLGKTKIRERYKANLS